MNATIEKLAEQCYYINTYSDKEIFDYKKFAQLIVVECAAEADKCAERGSWMAGYRIKQHFGVEDE